MTSPWHFGNTTVRNPLRIKEGLTVLQESNLNGNLIGGKQERALAFELDKAGVSKVGSQLEFYGRKWRSCFSQLGFITHKFNRSLKVGERDPVICEVVEKYPTLNLSGLPFELTPNGERMIEAQSVQEQQECMLRALVAYQTPSIIEKDKDEVPFKPFIFILMVLKELSNKNNSLGLSSIEMGIVQSHSSFEELDEVIEEIMDYRRNYKSAERRVAKKKVDSYLLEALGNKGGVKPSTIKDYADVNFRYPRLTGLVSHEGRRLVLNSKKESVVNQLIAESSKNTLEDEIDYLSNLWNGATLPTDHEEISKKEIIKFKELLLNKGLDESLIPLLPDTNDVRKLNQTRIRMESLYQHELEKQYAESQKQKSQLEETIAYLKRLDKQSITDDFNLKIEDEPSYLEWSVWRAFLSLNNLVNSPHEARRFKVDQDFFPMGCAPGGGPDLIFEFKNYVLVVEVTLTTSSRQEAAEGEPVRRHIAREKERILNLTEKPVYGLFIARKIDNNTAETFRIGVWYNGDEPDFLNIVPLTLKQFIKIMEKYSRKEYDDYLFRKLLDSCLIPRNAHAPAWKKEIEKVINEFI